MFDWSGKNGDMSGKSQGILISCVSGNPDCVKELVVYGTVYGDIALKRSPDINCKSMVFRSGIPL